MGITFDTILGRLRRDNSPASQAEMEAGTETEARAMSPLAVAQAIAALSPTVGEGKPASGKTTPVDADTLQLWDSDAAEAGKSLTWANVKATLALVFAGLTHASTHAAAGDDPLAPADIGAATAAQGALAETALQPTGSGAQLTGITANQVGAEPTQSAASQAEMEAGTESGTRSMSPLRVAQAIAALAEGGGGLVSVLAECTAESFAWPNANWTNYSQIGSFSTTERMPRYLLDSAREEPWLMPQAFAIPAGVTGLRFVVCYKPEATCDGSKVAWTSRYIKCTDNAAWGNEVETTLGYDTLPSSGTAPQIYSVDKTLAELSLAVGDHVRFWLSRDGDDGTNDTFAADVGMYWCKIEAY